MKSLTAQGITTSAMASTWKVNPKTLLFEGLTLQAARELHSFAEKIVKEGCVHMQHPAFVVWIKAANYSENQALLTYSTVFPQRALLSVCDVFSLALTVVTTKTS